MSSFRGTYTGSQLAEISNIAARRFGGRSPLQNIGCSTLTGVALIVLPLVAYFGGDPPSSVFGWIPLGLVALGLTAVNRWGSRREFNRHPLANKEISGVFAEEGVTFETETSESRIRWAGFGDYALTQSFILLVNPLNAVFAIPRTFFSSETDFDTATQLVSARVHRVPKPMVSWRAVFSLITWIVIIVMVFLLWSLFRTNQAAR